MILVGNARAGGQNLATHLLSPENEQVKIHEISGFASNDLHGAFKEAEAVSRGTRCKKYLYSLSLSPPPKEDVCVDIFEAAITQAENRLGLTGQPRAVVFHSKLGDNGNLRHHCHIVWSRIDSEKMKAIPMSYPKLKLKEVAKSLYLEHEWEMPKGFIDPKFRDPMNFTLEEWQQAKRQGKDPREIKAIIKSCWQQSDNRKSFANALKEHGYMLARGDRRGHVATDMHGKVFTIRKYADVKSKDVKARLGDPNDLPSLSEAKEQLADRLAPAIDRLQQQQAQKLKDLKAKQEQEHQAIKAKAEAQRKLQKEWQAKREQAEAHARKERFNKGARGLLDRVTAKHAKTKEQNRLEEFRNAVRDQQQRDALILKQQENQDRLKALQDKAREKPQDLQRELKSDAERLKALREKSPRPDLRGADRTRDGP